MIYKNEMAIKYLINNIENDARFTSSHWQKYHKNFKVDKNGKISGAIGFGGSEMPYTGFKLFLHKFFQNRYRKIGKKFSNFYEIDKIASRIIKKQNRAYDLDVLRQVLTISFLIDHINFNKISSIAVIGDGFSTMSSLLVESGLAKQLILVNLSKTLLVDLVYLSKVIKNQNIILVNDKDDIKKNNFDAEIIAIQAYNHSLLRSMDIDLVINIASMQEMNIDVVNNYFKDMRIISKRKKIYFYCCNREEKTLPDGSVTRFNDYDWNDNDKIIKNELCKWHQKYYSLKPPFYRKYDGPIRHRLICLK